VPPWSYITIFFELSMPQDWILFLPGRGHLARAEAEDVDVDRAGDVACRVELAGGSVDDEDVVTREIVLEPLDGDELSGGCGGQDGMRYEQTGGDKRQKPTTETLRHGVLPWKAMPEG